MKPLSQELEQFIKDWGGDRRVAACFEQWEQDQWVAGWSEYDRELAYAAFLGGIKQTKGRSL